MSWGTPFTAVVGLPIRASDQNGIRDDLLETAVAKVTTAGDLVYATGANTLTRVGIGTAGQALVVNAAATAPTWVGFVGARVYDTSNQLIPNNLPTVLLFGLERFKTVASLHSTSSNTSRLVADRAGYWQVSASIGWLANATGWRALSVYVNGTTQYARASAPVNSGTNQTLQSFTAPPLLLAANDYVEILAVQDSGGNLGVVNSGPWSPEFSMHYLGS
jgi:hypothetical protein